MIYKCLSIKQPWAQKIITGEKKLEIRSWQVKYRGDIVICSSKSPEIPGCKSRYALAIACIKDIFRFEKKHEKLALCDCDYDDLYAWELENIREIKPIPVKGFVGLWNLKANLVVIPPTAGSRRKLKRSSKTR